MGNQQVVEEGPGFFEKFQLRPAIEQWLKDQRGQYRDIMRVSSIGKSHRGNHIYSVTIERPDCKKNVLITSGIHPREVLAIPVALWIIKELCENEKFCAGYNFVIIPLVNPDGYDKVQVDKMWRSNSRGVDLNRNFEVGWEKVAAKESMNPGTEAASERETQNVIHFLKRIAKSDWEMTIDLHTYSQSIVLSWGYKDERYNENLCMTAANAFQNCMAQNDANYSIKNAYGFYKDAKKLGGLLIDQELETLKPKVGWTLELDPKGYPCFSIAATEIVNVGLRTAKSIEAALIAIQ